MKRLVSGMCAVAAALLCGFPTLARAQSITPVAAMVCQPSSGTGLTEPVFEFEIVVEQVLTYNFEEAVFISDADAFSDIFPAAAASKVYPTCTVSGGGSSITFNQAQFVDDVLLGYGSGLLGSYDPALNNGLAGTETLLCFASYTVNGVTYPVNNPFASCSEETAAAGARRMQGSTLLSHLTRGGK